MSTEPALSLAPSPIEEVTLDLHGRPVGFRRTVHPDPDAPVVVLVHGMAGSSAMWVDAMRQLGKVATIVAPDLLGHGDTAKFRGDYSLGNQASLLRDLMTVLGIESATVVGQSLGGGVVMQFAYQYPQMCQRLVLVDAGGLGREVSTVLKLLALPGAGWLLTAVTAPPVRAVVDGVIGLAGKVGFHLGGEERQIRAAYESLADTKTRRAFLATLRSVVDHSGQRVGAGDRLYLARDLPTLVVWGDHDPIIPLRHSIDVVEVMPHARVEVFEGAGHFPHNSAPGRFAQTVAEFISSTEAASFDTGALRDRLAAGR